MNVKTKDVRSIVRILDDLIEDYNLDEKEEKRNWKEYEKKVMSRIRTAVDELSPLIEEAIATLCIHKEEKRGSKPKLSLKQKIVLLITQRLIKKSNRDMSNLLALFSMLSEIDISYKSVERLYSDQEVILVMHNLHILILRKKGIVEADCSGDGTGYTLTIKENYATIVDKLKEKAKDSKEVIKKKKKVFVYSFALLDIKKRMYIAFGTSFISEKQAFLFAIEMAKNIEVSVNSIRLDRYYSGQSYVELILKELGNVKITLIPKKNATVDGCWEWKRILHDFVNDPITYLEDYFKRTQSESCFSEDKKRTGWIIYQKKEERVNTANFCNILIHNLFWLGN